MLRAPTPEELEAAARVKTAEGNTAEAEELMKAAEEARQKLGQQAVDAEPEEGLLRAATPEELAKAASGDKQVAPVTPEQQQAAQKDAEKVAAAQAIEEQEQQQKQQQAAQAEATKQQQADTAFAAALTPSDDKPEMAFGEFMKAQKKKQKLEYDPNDGVIANEPKGHKEKEDLATKVAEMNKAAEERHKADQDDELETGQLRAATQSEAEHAAKTGEGGQTQQQDDGDDTVPDRIKSMEAGIDKSMKSGSSNSDRAAADGSENPDADARAARQLKINPVDLPGPEGQAARAAEEAGMISASREEVQLLREHAPPS